MNTYARRTAAGIYVIYSIFVETCLGKAFRCILTIYWKYDIILTERIYQTKNGGAIMIFYRKKSVRLYADTRLRLGIETGTTEN